MESSQLAALGLTLIRISVFFLYALVGAICSRKLFPRFSPISKQMASVMLAAQLLVIALALRDQPTSQFDHWLWNVHEEGNVPSTLASTQLALVAIVALLTAWLSKARPTAERLYLVAIGLIFIFLARDEYTSIHEHIENWGKVLHCARCGGCRGNRACGLRALRGMRGYGTFAC